MINFFKRMQILCMLFLLPCSAFSTHISYFNVSPYLAAVKIENPDQPYWAKKLPIRAWMENYAIVEWNQDSEASCARMQLQVETFSGEGRQWIVSHLHEHDIAYLQETLPILFKASDSMLVKATEKQAFDLVERGYHIEEINAHVEVPIDNSRLFNIQVTANDPNIEAMVAQVNANAIDQTVSDLVDFGTRKATTQGGLNAQNWIMGQYTALGMTDVSLHPVANQPTHHDNIVAVHTGISQPDQIVVVGGHYDSILSGLGGDTFAPGADDNASGAAGVLETARILTQYDFEKTIIFVAFASEEYGLLGSKSYAQNLSGQGENVVAMINLDMIGHLQAGDAFDLDIIKNSGSTVLYNIAKQAIEDYVPNLPVVEGFLPPGANSDHASFWNQGYPAVFFFEDSDAHSSMIHSTQDTIGASYNSINLAKAITQATVATVATLAVPYQTSGPSPDPVPEATPGGDPGETLTSVSPSIQSSIGIAACQQQSSGSGLGMFLLLAMAGLGQMLQRKKSRIKSKPSI